MGSNIQLSRADLTALFGNNPRAVLAFDELFRLFGGLSDTVDSTASAAQGLQNASVVTLSPNDAFTNERILAVDGVQITKTDNGTNITLSIVNTPRSSGYPVVFQALADTSVVLPTSGKLATTLLGGGPFADDAAAAAGGILIGEAYRQPLGVVAWRQV